MRTYAESPFEGRSFHTWLHSNISEWAIPWYFHFTDYGKKMKLLQKDNRVCVSIENLSPDMSSYSFVSFRGELEQVNSTKERERAIKKLSEKGSEKLSENFLAAHGFKAEEGWESLSHEKPLVIYKLKTISETTGLKSP